MDEKSSIRGLPSSYEGGLFTFLSISSSTLLEQDQVLGLWPSNATLQSFVMHDLAAQKPFSR